MKRSLTDTAVKHAKPKEKPYKLTDGGGLYLLVSQTGKYWRQNYSHNGKQKTLALGVYPDVSLALARERHQQARELLAQGVDPSTHKQEARAAELARAENSFELVAREWHGKFSGKWSAGHAKQILTRLEQDVFPLIGGKPVAGIEPPEILKCLRRIEGRGAVSTAHRVRTDIGQVFRYAVATGKATRDPTPDLKGALAPVKKEHFPAITKPQEAGGLMRSIAGYHGDFKTVSALQLCAYLFQRPGEIRAMEWAEIDLETALWEIPAERMKKREPHLVPLSTQALAILEGLRPLTGRFKYVFPSKSDITKPMNKNTLPHALHIMGYGADTMTAHGFRAMARTILDEVIGAKETHIEHQLSHAVKDANGKAYNRTSHLPQRTAMMQQWADYLDSLRDGAQVIPIRRAG